MGKKSFSLGRSLADILKDHSAQTPVNQEQPTAENESINNAAAEDSSQQKIVEIDVNLVDPNPFQPRKTFNDDELVELAETIEKHGLIQPIAVRKVGDRYQIISGERRTRATKLAGLATIKAQVYENLDDKIMGEWALIENIQRVDLNPVEVAQSYQQLIDLHGYTHDDLAKTVGKSRSAITNALRLLKLPMQVLAWIQEGKISSGAARVLCSDKIDNPEEIARRAIEEGLNVRQLEALSRGEDINTPSSAEVEVHTGDDSGEQNIESPTDPQTPPAQPAVKRELSADLKQFENRLETFFGTKVQLNPSAATESKGTIVINYYSMDDLTRIQELMENR
ncbi:MULTISPECIES: ParB/RepB/Spo0J family partition protein [unclassified Fibrobacter]|uniref:ParB/RepB/Spo0J family partition protein n=1 Tax=unclassified Fibrobacter TaxID=2634177 RepID=UPI000D6C0E33|nr:MULTISPECIES: ParB/RepB/Spo0J family partition protein [unclassified Fibrobacter]PWJ63364.1 ParB family chromosome partitioning protein [Fibrobacter sp. UWR4]PZW68299.1 ParB family chromosome partitioning protein [Fibrobacter sp. UWR1]